MLRVGPALTARDWLRHRRFQGLLAPRFARAQHIEADPRDDRGQPAAQVPDRACVGAAEMQPGLLDGVVGLAQVAEHAVGHRLQVGVVGLELFRQPFVFVHWLHSFMMFCHRSHSSIAFRHSSDEGNPPDVTGRLTPIEALIG